MRIGRHMPLGAQPLRALRTARDMGCETVQIFVTNPRGWRVPSERPAAEEAFRAARRELALDPVVVHATYLINLASPRDDFFAGSIHLLRATLERAARYGAGSVVLHIGSHMGSGEEAGIARLIAGLRQTLDGSPPEVRLLLENDVGAGGELGARFEHIAIMLDALPAYAGQLGVCLDTAHLWGAGFDIGTPAGASATLAAFDAVVGLHRIVVIHLNDTRVALGSHRDVHARMGDGIIGRAGLETLLRHPALASTTVLLETPIVEQAPGKQDWAHDARHLRLAFELAGRTPPDSPLLAAATAQPEAVEDAAADALGASDVRDTAAARPRPRRRAKEPVAAAPRKRTRGSGEMSPEI
jgi:deoxyribonuclease IV